MVLYRTCSGQISFKGSTPRVELQASSSSLLRYRTQDERSTLAALSRSLSRQTDHRFRRKQRQTQDKPAHIAASNTAFSIARQGKGRGPYQVKRIKNRRRFERTTDYPRPTERGNTVIRTKSSQLGWVGVHQILASVSNKNLGGANPRTLAGPPTTGFDL